MRTDVQITGIDDVNAMLSVIAPREARNLLRSTVAEIAKEGATEARANAPVDEGLLQSAIGHKRERGSPTSIEASVVVKRSGKKGDPFYWSILEYGQGPDGVAHAFFLRAVEVLRGDLDARFLRVFVQRFEARLARLRKKAAG